MATRARLLAAAEDLFTRRGYAGTAIGDVAARAGVGVGTLYHHFPDKRALLLALVDAWGERVAARRRTELDHARFLGDDPRSGIRRWLRGAYERLRKRPSLYLVVLGLAGRDDEVRARWEAIQRVGVERLAGLVAFGQRRGWMRRGLDPAAAAFLVHHTIDMAAVQLLVAEPRAVDPDRVLDGLGDMICRYLLEETP